MVSHLLHRHVPADIVVHSGSFYFLYDSLYCALLLKDLSRCPQISRGLIHTRHRPHRVVGMFSTAIVAISSHNDIQIPVGILSSADSFVTRFYDP